MRGRPAARPPLRRAGGLLVLTAGNLGGGLAWWWLVAPSLRALVGVEPLSLPTLPLDQLVVAGCAVAATACLVWLTGCTWLVAARVLRDGVAAAQTGSPSRAARGCPRLVQVLVLVALGAPAAPAHAAPAGSADHPAAPGLTGLPVPDRLPATALGRQVRVRLIEIRPGDSLWRVAQRLLPGDAPDALVDRTWRALAARNAARLGPDPDLIFPGTLLRVPGPARALGKDDR